MIEKFSKDHPYEWEYELDHLFREEVALEELRAASCRWSSTDPRYEFYGGDHYRQWDGRWKNETGFSLLPAGYYDPWKNFTETGWRYVGCAAYLYASPSKKGARYFTGCTSILLSTLGDLYKSLRCIKEVTEAETDSIEVSVDSLAN